MYNYCLDEQEYYGKILKIKPLFQHLNQFNFRNPPPPLVSGLKLSKMEGRFLKRCSHKATLLWGFTMPPGWVSSRLGVV